MLMDRDSRRMRSGLPFVFTNLRRGLKGCRVIGGRNRPFLIIAEARSINTVACEPRCHGEHQGVGCLDLRYRRKDALILARHPAVLRPWHFFPRLFGRQRVRRPFRVKPVGDSWPATFSDSCRPGSGGACGHDDSLRQSRVSFSGKPKQSVSLSVAPGAVIEWFRRSPFRSPARFRSDHGSHIGQGRDRLSGTVLPPAEVAWRNAGLRFVAQTN